MIKIMLVSPDEDSFADFEQNLEKNADVETIWEMSGKDALERISHTDVDLVVTDQNLGDMTNLEFAGSLIKINPMINCATVSSLSSTEFHEASEGLGMMCQLSFPPGKKDADEVMEKLRIIRNATGIEMD